MDGYTKYILRYRRSRKVSKSNYSKQIKPRKINKIRLDVPDKKVMILRMVLRDSFSVRRIPAELAWTIPAIDIAEANQKSIGINHQFLYITVRSTNESIPTNDVWHTDGYSEGITHLPEQNYTWCNKYPTEYFQGTLLVPSDLDPLKHDIHKYFQEKIPEDHVPFVCEEETLYETDVYDIHKRPDHPIISRCFVRITFCPIEINDVNNTQNPLIPKKYNRDGVEEFRNKLTTYKGANY